MSSKIGGIEVAYKPTPAVGRDGDNYPGFAPGRNLLSAGHRKQPTYKPFTTDTIFERDIAIPMRDGTILRSDIFRPVDSDEEGKRVPILLPWSPYGKTGSGVLNLYMMPGRAGVPESALSGYEKFEAPDPAEWVPRDYAIANVDARGIFCSEGDIVFPSNAEGRDGYDTIEFLAQMPWCTGDVAFPPHLKCFAPFEGVSDLFRETISRGGVPQPAFWDAVVNTFSGRGKTEDVIEMVKRYPDWNEYWADKRVDFSKIRVPAYVLASWSSFLHSRCYQELRTPKWIEELQLFFDHFLKGADNGWEKTPSVRAALLGYNEPNLTDIALKDWPGPETEYERFFLSSNGRVENEPSNEAGSSSYQADIACEQKHEDGEEMKFRHVFSESTHLLGHSRVEPCVSCPDQDDLDIFVQLRKADKDRNILRSMNVPVEATQMTKDELPPINILKYLGPTGTCRASRRELDPELSKPGYPVPSLKREKSVPAGQVVKLEIGIWPGGMIFAPGESLVLEVPGHPMVLAEFTSLWGSHQTANVGRHRVHFGGEYPSFVQVPFVKLE